MDNIFNGQKDKYPEYIKDSYNSKIKNTNNTIAAPVGFFKQEK